MGFTIEDMLVVSQDRYKMKMEAMKRQGFRSDLGPDSTSCQNGTKLGGGNKKDPYFYIQVTERNTKKRTALVRLKR